MKLYVLLIETRRSFTESIGKVDKLFVSLLKGLFADGLYFTKVYQFFIDIFYIDIELLQALSDVLALSIR